MTASPFIPPKVQLFDNNGDPLAGGKVYTYAAGTNTPKNSYTDYSASSANTNPVILDSSGMANIWLNGVYKIRVDNALDVTQYTVDNVNQMQDILADSENYTVSPEMFGAVGDGVTDDSAAFALAVAESITRFGYPRLDLHGNKSYLLGKSAIDISDKSLVINGNGATLIFNDAGSGFFPIRAQNSFTNQKSVTAFADGVAVNLSNGTATPGYVTTQVTQLTVADVSGWAKDDVFKLISDDYTDSSDVAQNQRNGEFHTVGAVCQTLAYDALTASFTVPRTLEYKSRTVAFVVGGVLTGATSGATAAISSITVDPSDSTKGTLTLNSETGYFSDAEIITGSLGGSATANGVLSENYQTITGGTSGATGVVHKSVRNGATGTLTLKDITGVFLDNELLTGSSIGSATANGVLSVGGDIYTRNASRYTCTTGIKIGKIQTDKRVFIRGLTISAGANIPLLPTHMAITLFGVYMPVLEDVRITSWRGSGVNLVGCYNDVTINYHASNLPTDTTNNLYGYGLVRTGCYGGRDVAPTGYNIRHLITTNFLPCLAGDNKFAERGRTVGALTFGGYCKNSTAASFDMHPDADSCQYVSCVSENPYCGMYGSDFGFQIRGLSNRLINCHVIGGTGYRILVDEPKGKTTGIVLDGCSHDCPVDNTSTSRFGVTTVGTATSRVEVTIENFNWKKNNGGTDDYAVSLYYTDARIINPRFDAAMNGTSPQVIKMQYSTIYGLGGLCDFSQSVGSGHLFADILTTGCTINWDGLNIKAGTVSWAVLASLNSNVANISFTNVGYDNWGTDSDGFTGMVAGTNVNLTINEPLFSGQRAFVEDDFLGFSVSAVNWTLFKGSDGGLINYTRTTERGGTIMATNTGAGNSMATSGTQIVGACLYSPANGRLVFEAAVKVGADTNVALFIGLTDNDASLEMPFTLAAGNVLTSNATNGAGFLFDTAADTDTFCLVGVATDVDATKQFISDVPNTSVFRHYRVVVERDGSATFYIGRKKVGTAMTGAVTPSALLNPTVASFARTNATKTVTIDKLLCSQQR